MDFLTVGWLKGRSRLVICFIFFEIGIKGPNIDGISPNHFPYRTGSLLNLESRWKLAYRICGKDIIA